jgi:hypothetical protein
VFRGAGVSEREQAIRNIEDDAPSGEARSSVGRCPEASAEALQFLDTFGKYTLSLIAGKCMPGDQPLHAPHSQFDVGHIGSDVATTFDEQRVLVPCDVSNRQSRNIV